MLVPSFLVTTLLALEGAEAEYEQIRGEAQNFLGPRGVKYLNTGLITGLNPHTPTTQNVA
jgi:hypothetical protein